MVEEYNRDIKILISELGKTNYQIDQWQLINVVLDGLSRPKWDNFIENFGLHLRQTPPSSCQNSWRYFRPSNSPASYILTVKKLPWSPSYLQRHIHPLLYTTLSLILVVVLATNDSQITSPRLAILINVASVAIQVERRVNVAPKLKRIESSPTCWHGSTRANIKLTPPVLKTIEMAILISLKPIWHL